MGNMDWTDDEVRKDRDYLYDEGMTAEKKMKVVMIVLASVIVILGGVLLFVWLKNSNLIEEKNVLLNDLNIEKEELTAQMIELQNDYATLSTDNDSLNVKLMASREEVDQLIERLKNTEATNRTMIRKYEKELGTLRSIMRNYIVQIDSLNTRIKHLDKENVGLKKQVAESRKQSEEKSKAIENLTNQVAAGSIIKARGIKLEALDSKGKVFEKTPRANRVNKMIVSLSLVENALAESRPVRVYVRVKDPNGILLTNSTQRTFQVAGGEPMICSASREVDYTGSEVEMSIYINEISSFEKGVYTAEVYTEQTKLGQSEYILK